MLFINQNNLTAVWRNLECTLKNLFFKNDLFLNSSYTVTSLENIFLSNCSSLMWWYVDISALVKDKTPSAKPQNCFVLVLFYKGLLNECGWWKLLNILLLKTPSPIPFWCLLCHFANGLFVVCWSKSIFLFM